jgi:gamma-glutamyltranspeptidase/glutathione hydrolase
LLRAPRDYRRASNGGKMAAGGTMTKPARALVTGASSGIGAAISRRLAARGIEVWLAARRREALDAEVAAIVAAGGRAHALVLDVNDADATAARLAALIDPDRALPDPAGAAGAVHRETVYLTVVDRDRMAVSLICSTFHSFGSGLASARFGINFHNRGAGFSLVPGHPNEAGGGKRPMHTIIPAMLRRCGRLVMPFGVMGGAYQPAGHVRLLGNVIDHGMDLQSAIDAPRWVTSRDRLAMEARFPRSVIDDLAQRGHSILNLAAWDGTVCRSQVLASLPEGGWAAASDLRGEGVALAV